MLKLEITIILALVATQAIAFSIKGNQHESRSLKSPAQQQQHQLPVDQASKQPLKAQVAASAPVPVLESSKKVYNDESIRRLVQPLVEQPAAAPVSVVDQQQQHVPVVPVVEPAVPVPVAPIAAQPAVVQHHQVVPAVVHDAPVVHKIEHVQPADVSERSVPVKPVVENVQVPAVAAPLVDSPLVVSKLEQPVVSQVAPVVQIQPAQVVPVVAQSAPVVQPAVPVVPVVAPIVPVPVPAASPVVPEPEKKSVVVPESVLEAKKDDHAHSSEQALPEVPAPDPQLVLSEPIDSTTKLLIDLDEHVQKFLPQDDKDQAGVKPAHDPSLISGIDFSPADPKGKSGPLLPYSTIVSDDSIVPPLPVLDGVEKNSGAASGIPQASPANPAGSAGSQSLTPVSSASSSSSVPSSQSSASRQGGNNHQNQNQQQVITQLMDQLDSLQNRIQDTINQLVARRRYVMSALLRPMGTYVRRVRTNLERLQNRVNQLQAAASSVGSGGNRPGGFVDAAAIETIRRRIDDISKRISDIVNRIRFSLTPTSAPLSSSNGK